MGMRGSQRSRKESTWMDAAAGAGGAGAEEVEPQEAIKIFWPKLNFPIGGGGSYCILLIIRVIYLVRHWQFHPKMETSFRCRSRESGVWRSARNAARRASSGCT